MMLRVLILTAALIFAGCASPRPSANEAVTVEGEVTARGHEPFSAYVLETDEHNLYVLQLSEEVENLSTPARLRVTGLLTEDEWDGRPFAHIRVSNWERVD